MSHGLDCRNVLRCLSPLTSHVRRDVGSKKRNVKSVKSGESSCNGVTVPLPLPGCLNTGKDQNLGQKTCDPVRELKGLTLRISGQPFHNRFLVFTDRHGEEQTHIATARVWVRVCVPNAYIGDVLNHCNDCIHPLTTCRSTT
ncbi:unnamed protein product [Boreogadus saida]